MTDYAQKSETKSPPDWAALARDLRAAIELRKGSLACARFDGADIHWQAKKAATALLDTHAPLLLALAEAVEKPVAFMVTQQIGGKGKQTVFIEPFFSADPEYVQAHSGYNWRPLYALPGPEGEKS